MTSSIDTFEFARLDPPPRLATHQLVTRTRAGAEGVAVQRVGRWAPAFDIESLTLVPTLYDGLAEYSLYAQLVGAGAVEVVWADTAFLDADHLFHVMDVQITELTPVLLGITGDTEFGARLRCQWKLLPLRI